jgi:hypothetical protein
MIIITPKYNLLMPLYSCKIVDFAQSNTRSLTKSGDVTIFCFYCWCFNTTFSNISDISWRPVLLVEETGVHGENHRPWAGDWITLSLAAASRVQPHISDCIDLYVRYI